jgi:hypothetical protein
MPPARVAMHCSTEGIVPMGYRNRVINLKTERVELTGNRKAESTQAFEYARVGKRC